MRRYKQSKNHEMSAKYFNHQTPDLEAITETDAAVGGAGVVDDRRFRGKREISPTRTVVAAGEERTKKMLCGPKSPCAMSNR
jgi:hypothetical protein